MEEVTYIISIGGHLLQRGAKSLENLDLKWYERYAKIIMSIRKMYKVVVVCGGGDLARIEIAEARKAGASKLEQDMIGIKWTHKNADILAKSLGDVASVRYKPEIEIEDILKDLNNNKIPVCGGDKPGHSTDYDAVFITKEIKERTGKDAIFIDVRKHAVYDKDPAIYPDAKKYDELSSGELLELANNLKQEPGTYQIDRDAVEIIHKHKVKTIIIDGYHDPEEIIRAVEGKHNGTVIS